MKRLIYSLAACLVLMYGTSCTDVDNYDGPDAAMNGRIIDATTGENFIAGQGEFSVRIWEMSWSDNPTPQNLVVKQDGTYNHLKLFSGTYDVQPYDGPFWPVEKTTDVKLSGTITHDFTVTPYLKIIQTEAELNGTTLTLSCKLQAPVTQNLPQVIEIRPFISLTQFCGAGSRIEEYFKDHYRVLLNKNWGDGIGAMVEDAVSNDTYSVGNLELKSGRTYYVRMGAKVRDTYEKYNYSEIIKVTVP